MKPILSYDQYLQKLLAAPRPGAENFLAYYDHRVGAICTDPRLMLLPLDDHLAHRGDGIFETVKYSDGYLYRLDRHLERMHRSAAGIFLEPPCSWQELRELVIEVAGASKTPTGQIRILLGRGPGGFGIDPAESPVSSLYLAAYRFVPKPAEWYQKGLKGFRTRYPAKQGYMAKIKTANYLPNALMIREAGELGKDTPFCFDEDYFLTESAIANICLVSQDDVIEVPEFVNALPGTTMMRALELLEGKITYRFRRLRECDLDRAKELLLLGTGPDCVAVTEYEGKPVGEGTEGPVAKMLRELIREDIRKTGIPVPGLQGTDKA